MTPAEHREAAIGALRCHVLRHKHLAICERSLTWARDVALPGLARMRFELRGTR